ncbi:ferritin heavy chain A-like [Podarcis lilfordi]|uniref:Ferritin n=1 Tax=Podarcis lilfordi TaxID=74358 RepID=A0AA35P436_9SAUR|nr:ferritin heavy chain A-like [Podarcis lilfordi]
MSTCPCPTTLTVMMLPCTTRLKEKEQSQEERSTRRSSCSTRTSGENILLKDIKKPEKNEWGSSLGALQSALELEKVVNQALQDLHKLATEKGDPHLCDFLETEYLEEQVKAIKLLGDHLTNLRRLVVPQNGTGDYLFNKLTLGESSCAAS